MLGPMLNILNGGAHAASNVDVQEFMVMPHGFDSFEEGLRAGGNLSSTQKELKQDGLLGGLVMKADLPLICQAMKKASVSNEGYRGSGLFH